MTSTATSPFVLPGQKVPISSQSNASKGIKLGPGLFQLQSSSSSTSASSSSHDATVVATKPGVLHNADKGRRWWVEGNSKRYVPSAGESVIGVVIARHAEGFRVDLGSAHVASLDALAFEGASKRNRPNLRVGSTVYARVSLANRDMEPEVECADPTTHKAEGFGELKEGFMVVCSLGLARALLAQSHPLLPTLGARFPFEIAIGLNGKVWFKAPDIAHTIALARAIEWADEQEPDLLGTVSEGDVRKWLDANLRG